MRRSIVSIPAVLSLLLVVMPTAGVTQPAAPAAAVFAYEVPGEQYTYLPGGDELPQDTLFITTGGAVRFGNAGLTEHHSMTSFARTPAGAPRFNSGLVAPGSVVEVSGVSTLPAGRYRFYCLKHQYQQGALVVE